MNEELKNYEVNEDYEVNASYDEEPETEGNGVFGKLLVAGAAAAAAIGGVLYFTRDKREAKNIERLRKKGYVVCKAEVLESGEDHSEDDSED